MMITEFSAFPLFDIEVKHIDKHLSSNISINPARVHAQWVVYS